MMIHQACFFDFILHQQNSYSKSGFWNFKIHSKIIFYRISKILTSVFKMITILFYCQLFGTFLIFSEKLSVKQFMVKK